MTNQMSQDIHDSNVIYDHCINKHLLGMTFRMYIVLAMAPLCPFASVIDIIAISGTNGNQVLTLFIT